MIPDFIQDLSSFAAAKKIDLLGELIQELRMSVYASRLEFRLSQLESIVNIHIYSILERDRKIQALESKLKKLNGVQIGVTKRVIRGFEQINA